MATISQDADFSVWHTAPMALGDELRAWRLRKGYRTANALAEAIGDMDNGTVSRIEAGGKPTLSTLTRIAEFLGAEVEIHLVEAVAQKGTEGYEIPETSGEGGASLTSPVSLPPDPTGVPLGVVPMSSYPSSPSHLALYAFIADLTDEQARAVVQPVLDIVRRAQHGDESDHQPDKPVKRKH